MKRKLLKSGLIAFVTFAAVVVVRSVALPTTVDLCNGWQPHSHPNIETIDHYKEDDGYYIFKPKNLEMPAKSVVALVHGYGALNPLIFGAWIEHLVENGNIVIYPRYQRNLFLPAADEFTKNVGTALKNAFEVLTDSGHIDSDFKYVLAGHSFGGVISANLLIMHEEYDLPKPAGALIAEGGTGPFTGALLEDYSGIDPNIPLVVTIGEYDYTVGDYFGTRLFEEVRSKVNVFIKQKSFSGAQISSSHYEPYAIADWCDNGLENLTSRRAKSVGKLNDLDRNGYWYWLDTLIDVAHSSELDDLPSLFDQEEVLSIDIQGIKFTTEILEVRYKSENP